MELAIVLMMILIVVAIVAIKLSEDKISFPFMGRQQLFTPVERQFLDLIEKAVGNEFRVVSRVRLVDLIALRKNTDKKVAKSALMRAGSKQVDYVLCNKDDMTPVLAIDLVHTMGKDGHNRNKDFFVAGCLDTAGIPHARIKAKPGYKLEEIKDCIESKLVSLRRRQGKAPMANTTPEPSKSIFQPTKRPTRPIRTNRQVAA